MEWDEWDEFLSLPWAGLFKILVYFGIPLVILYLVCASKWGWGGGLIATFLIICSVIAITAI